MLDLAVQLPLAMALSLLFLSAALHKLKHGARFDAVLGAYRLLPAPLLTPARKTLATAEGLLALALLVPATWPVAGPAAAALLIAYGLAMAINLSRGRRHIDCGCGETPHSLSGALLLRNALLAAAALALVLPTATRSLGIVDYLIIAMACTALTLLYVTFEALDRSAAKLKAWSNDS